ncbi:MAG: Ig-like domain-containing protein, partial [Calditrichaeota bacterium]|nr:Ig-like domain-containing protein [Calditrichota bacterium]
MGKKCYRKYLFVLVYCVFALNSLVAQDAVTPDEQVPASKQETIIFNSPKLDSDAATDQFVPEDSISVVDAEGTLSATASGSDYYITVSWSGYSNPCFIGYSAQGQVTWNPGYSNDPISGDSNNGSMRVYARPSTNVSFTYSYTYSGLSCNGSYSQSTSASTAAFKAPTSVTATNETYIGKIVIDWNNVSDFATHYRVYRDGALIATLPRATTIYTDENVVNGESYTYTVASYNSLGYQSAGVSVTGKTFPMFPDASDGSYTNRVKVAWKNVSDFADEIKILRGNEEIGITSSNATSYFDYDAVPGKLYQYSIIPISNGTELGVARDYGFIRADGKISGKIKTLRGAGIRNVEVTAAPAKGDSTRSLRMDNVADYAIRKPIKSFPENAFTLSFWMKTSATDRTGSVFSYANTTSDNAVLIYDPRNFDIYINGASSGVTSVNAVDNTWHHIAVTWQSSNGQLIVYKDGTAAFTGTLAAGATIAGNGSIVLGQDQDIVGGNFQSNQAYLGLLDEIQLWNTALPDTVIARQMNQSLRGDEEGLVSYWPFDTPGRQPASIIGDFGRSGGNHLQGIGTSFSTDHAPVKTLTYTDPTGFYSIGSVFYNEATSFDVSVYKERHGFDPTTQERRLELNGPSAAGVDFTDTTSFAISGKILLNGTNCAVAGVNIERNGNFTAIKTNNLGEYVISIEEPGIYTITPVFEDSARSHVFEPAEVTLNVTDDVENLDFTDMTTSVLNGKVAGGCDAFIGRATLNISSKRQTGCYTREIETDVNGNYSITLPAQEYLIEVLSLNPPNPIITQTFPIKTTDLTFQDSTVNFIYRNPPKMKVAGFPTVCGGALAPFDVPVVKQFEQYVIEFEVYEAYGLDTCLVDTGKVTVYDALGGNPAEPVELPVSKGRAFYTTTVGEPNILDGGPHPFQKLFQAVADVDGKTVSFEQWAIIEGHKPRERTFVTKTPELPLMILRDPPGDESYAFLEKGSSFNTNFKLQAHAEAAAGIYWDIKIGAGVPVPFTGIVIGAKTHIEGQLLAGIETSLGSTIGTTISFTDRFTTSGNEDVTGSKGDVIMGASYNMIYALTDVIDYDETSCRVIQDTALVWGSEEVNTTYIYTEQHIRETLLPQLRLLRSLASPDSAIILGTFIEVWEQVLEKNAKMKQDAKFIENVSFSADASKDYSKTIELEEGFDIEFTAFIEGETKIGAGVGDGGKFADTEGGVAARFKLSTTIGASGSTKLTKTVGYHLGDNDAGDFFSVDVKRDPTFQTPVFELVAGTSSCPWEPGTQPRDGPSIGINSFEQNNINPTEPASFVLTLGNLSQSGETRSYNLSVLQSSNYDGAVISVGGVVIEDNLDYTIPAGQQITATMAVRRGPIAYSYQNLQLRLYSPCDPQIADTVTFSVNYESPCSTVELFKPDNNWIVNQASNDSLLVILREYDALNPRLESISLQYRKIGDSWKTAFTRLRAELPDQFIYEFWDVSGLPDGSYELRAMSKCGTDGVNYSEISAGIIDRSSLLVFGSPQPSDGVLNIGEDITVSFTAALNCPLISQENVSLTYSDSGQEIPVDVACSDKSLVITPQVDMATLERKNLTVTVSAVEDKNGNRIKKDVTWSFTVNQNALHWIVSNADVDVYQGSAENFTATLKNDGGTENSFTIAQLPSWLTAQPLNGTIPAGGTRDINFTVSDQLNKGLYADTVQAQANGQGDDPFYVNVNVLSEPPQWTLNPANYQYSMDIIAQLKEGDGVSSDENDIVAAFVGNEIRGKVNLSYVSQESGYLAFLTVYSNQQTGESVTFRSWNASEGIESGFIKETVTFEDNGSVGLLLSPFVLTPSGRAQNVALSPGWNWVSFNLQNSSMSVSEVLNGLNANAGDVIKGQQGMASYWDQSTTANKWVGDLQTIETGKSYRIYSASAQNLRFAGDTINVQEEDVPVFAGWNWIGFLPQKNSEINKAFKDFIPANGDRLRSQDAFSIYDAATSSWQGALTVLNPGEGYLLKTAKNGFISYTGQNIVTNSAKNVPADAGLIMAADPLSPYSYEFNMSVIGEVQLGGTTVSDTNYTVSAFIGDSLRSKARLKYYPEIGKALVFMTIYNNKESGDQLHFEISDASRGVLLPVTSNLEFVSDGITGSIDNPFGFAGLDEVAPVLRSAFLYSTEPGLADHIRLY